MKKPKKLRVSFDFDNTLFGDEDYCSYMVNLLRNHILLGDEVLILTARNKDHEKPRWIKKNQPNRITIQQFLKFNNIPKIKIIYTNHGNKGLIAKKKKINIHYDNDWQEIISCRENGIIGIWIGKKHVHTTS